MTTTDVAAALRELVVLRRRRQDDAPTAFEWRKAFLAADAALAAYDAPQPAQVEPVAHVEFDGKDNAGVWRTDDGFPSAETGFEAMLIARARGGHPISYSDTSTVIMDLRRLRAAPTAPAEGESAGKAEPAPTDDQVNDAVRAYIQAGKRGLDLQGAMRDAIAAAAPQAAAVPLTDEQIASLSYECRDVRGPRVDNFKFARAIERAHGIAPKAQEPTK